MVFNKKENDKNLEFLSRRHCDGNLGAFFVETDTLTEN